MHWAPGTTQEFQVSEGYVVSKSLLDIRCGMEGYGVQWFCGRGRQRVRKKQLISKRGSSVLFLSPGNDAKRAYLHCKTTSQCDLQQRKCCGAAVGRTAWVPWGGGGGGRIKLSIAAVGIKCYKTSSFSEGVESFAHSQLPSQIWNERMKKEESVFCFPALGWLTPDQQKHKTYWVDTEPPLIPLKEKWCRGLDTDSR